MLEFISKLFVLSSIIFSIFTFYKQIKKQNDKIGELELEILILKREVERIIDKKNKKNNNKEIGLAMFVKNKKTGKYEYMNEDNNPFIKNEKEK